MLSTKSPVEQKKIIGERLFPLVHEFKPKLASKITGILLTSENSTLLELLKHNDKFIATLVDIVQKLEHYYKVKEKGSVGYVSWLSGISIKTIFTRACEEKKC